MRIVFYLPIVTPWWFDNVIAPMIRHLSAVGEVHVMVPPLWSGTGINAHQLARFDDCPEIAWHILDGDDHPKLRVSAADFGDLIELVHAIGPDVVLCRSADIDTPRLFPGKVRYVMEGGFPPFPAGEEWIVLREHPFDYGIFPECGIGDLDALAEAFAPVWTNVSHRYAGPQVDRGALLSKRGLPRDRTVIALPLEYEHPENFFAIHRSIRSNADLIPAIAEEVGDEVVLAVTDHPLNRLYVNNREPLRQALERLGDRAIMVESLSDSDRPTLDVARSCAGMIVDNSKAISLAAFFGIPVARSSGWQTGEWVNAVRDLSAFAQAVHDGTAAAPDEAAARAWFAFHAANSVLNLSHPDVDGRLILDMIDAPVDPGRWQAGMGRYADVYPELFQ